MNVKLFRKEVIEHRRTQLLGEIMLAQPLTLSIGVVVIFVFAALALTFAATFMYARKENVAGWLVPDKGIAKLYPMRSGYVAAVHARDGAAVEANAPIATVVSTTALEAGGGLDAAISLELAAQSRLIEARLEQEAGREAGDREKLRAQVDGAVSEISALNRQIDLQKQRLEVSRSQTARLSRLAERGLVADAEHQGSRVEALEMEKTLSELLRSLSVQRVARAALRTSIEQLPIESAQRQLELKRQLSDLKQKAFESDARGAFKLISPVAGTVTAFAARVGEAVTTATPVATIIPDGACLEARLLVPTRAVGMMRPGLRVILRYDAFPYQRFGVHRGTVTSVARSILTPGELVAPVSLKEPVYLVTVSLEEQAIHFKGAEIPLQAGMLLTASVILEAQTVLAWLLEPFFAFEGLSG